MERRTIEKCRNIVIDYIHKDKDATVDKIEKELGVNIHRLFGGIEKAFEEADIEYPRKYEKNHFVKNALEDLQKNPLLSVEDLEKKYKFSFYKHFKNFKKFCKIYQLKFISRHEKRAIRKQLEIINYIKTHPNATQWEINKKCRTHVQDIFNRGIIEAFQKSGIAYPYFRRKIYGAADRKIKQRAIRFEKMIFEKLEKLGELERYVNTSNGIVDGILKTPNEKFAIEIKNYISKPISKSEITQLVKYMKSINCQNGILICNNKGNKDKIQIGHYKVIVKTPEELNGAVV